MALLTSAPGYSNLAVQAWVKFVKEHDAHVAYGNNFTMYIDSLDDFNGVLDMLKDIHRILHQLGVESMVKDEDFEDIRNRFKPQPSGTMVMYSDTSGHFTPKVATTATVTYLQLYDIWTSMIALVIGQPNASIMNKEQEAMLNDWKL